MTILIKLSRILYEIASRKKKTGGQDKQRTCFATEIGITFRDIVFPNGQFLDCIYVNFCNIKTLAVVKKHQRFRAPIEAFLKTQQYL